MYEFNENALSNIRTPAMLSVAPFQNSHCIKIQLLYMCTYVLLKPRNTLGIFMAMFKAAISMEKWKYLYLLLVINQIQVQLYLTHLIKTK